MDLSCACARNRFSGGTSVDAQNNVQSHQSFMDANALDYKANVFMLTMSFAF